MGSEFSKEVEKMKKIPFPFGIIVTGIAVYVAYKLGKSAGSEKIKEAKIEDKISGG